MSKSHPKVLHCAYQPNGDVSFWSYIFIFVHEITFILISFDLKKCAKYAINSHLQQLIIHKIEIWSVYQCKNDSVPG